MPGRNITGAKTSGSHLYHFRRAWRKKKRREKRVIEKNFVIQLSLAAAVIPTFYQAAGHLSFIWGLSSG